MTAAEVRYRDLRNRILDQAARLDDAVQERAQAFAALELCDVRETLMGCETEAERDALVRRWLKAVA